MGRTWDRKRPTKEELERRRKAIEEQKVLFELEVAIEEEAIAFRDLYLKRLEETVTLDDILAELHRKHKRLGEMIRMAKEKQLAR